jgi:hypothetical protein
LDGHALAGGGKDGVEHAGTRLRDATDALSLGDGPLPKR